MNLSESNFMVAENNSKMRKFLTNRNILTEELENAAILKDLVKSITGNNSLDQTYFEIVVTLANKFLETLKDDSTIEIKVPDHLIDDIRKEIKRELSV